MATKHKKYEDDDGRVIAPMNVEGMPWYDKRKAKSHKEAEAARPVDPVSKEDTRWLIGRMYLIMLPIILVFFAVFAVVILIVSNL